VAVVSGFEIVAQAENDLAMDAASSHVFPQRNVRKRT
jgi:hypothetical protein